MRRLIAMLRDDSGAALAEYALVTATLSVLMIAAFAAIAAQCTAELSNTSTKLAGLGTSPP